jgi:hypothetical protein
MMEQIVMIVMADRNIEKLLPHRYTRCGNCPTGFQHFHGPANNSLLSTICTDNLNKNKPTILITMINKKAPLGLSKKAY